MRSWMGLTRGLMLSSMLLAGAPACAEDITVTTWGGSYTRSQQMAYGAPWQKATGKTIRWNQYNGGLEQIREQVAAGEVTWDVVDVLPHEARLGCAQGLFETIPESVFQPAPDGRPFVEDLMIPRPNNCVAPLVWWSYVTFFNAHAFTGKKAPATIADFFDPQAFPGKRAVQTWPNGIIEMALIADGVALAEVYETLATPGGLDRAFAKLDTLGDNVVFWTSGAKSIDLVRTGEAVLATAYNGRVGAAVLSDGQNLTTIWDGQVLEEEWFVIPRGTKNKQAALDFIAFATAPEQQAAQARFINYGPMRRSAFKIIAAGEPWFHNGKKVMPHMPNRANVIARSLFARPDWWQMHGAVVSQRYKAWVDARLAALQ